MNLLLFSLFWSILCCISFNVPCSLTFIQFFFFSRAVVFLLSYLPFFSSCPSSHITCHSPREPLFCVSVTSWKIHCSYLFLLPLLSRSVCVSITVSHRPLQLFTYCMSLHRWLVCFISTVLFMSASYAQQSCHSFLSFKLFHLSAIICLHKGLNNVMILPSVKVKLFLRHPEMRPGSENCYLIYFNYY